MRILILRSERRTSGEKPKDVYSQEFTSSYAEKVIGNLAGEEGFCSACGPDCNACRTPYNRKFAKNIAGVIAFPPILPYLLEKPRDYVPRDIPAHDILLAINIHEQILIEILKGCSGAGTRGAVVPLEAGEWVSGSAQSEARAICEENDVEICFPKPFCGFDPPSGTVLDEFRRRFHIGKPEVELELRGDTIGRAYVNVSAACGATYYVARWLAGKRVNDDLKYQVISKRLHSYPCTASMKWDDELGDTPLHVAGQAHYEILAPLRETAPEEPAMVMSPVGKMVLKPVPVQENVENVERAKRAILEELRRKGTVSLAGLKRKRKITPAAMHSALLILKQEGKIRTEGQKIVKV